jgi:hypothetical protein
VVKLREALLKTGRITDIRQTDMRCPFHPDRSPSATLYQNEMRCWSKCHRTYKLMDFQALLGPGYLLDMSQAPDHPPEERPDIRKSVMFYY